MSPPCGHPYESPPVEDCTFCRLRDHPFHKARWTGQPAAGPCVHLGDPTGDVRECESCAGRVRLKVMGCAVHGQCTTGRPVAGLAYCGACPDRRPA